jgi:hypothetical protein
VTGEPAPRSGWLPTPAAVQHIQTRRPVDERADKTGERLSSHYSVPLFCSIAHRHSTHEATITR